MRRGTGDSTGSLELLLDTICNMFGGIVLIFILLAVLSQLSTRETEAPIAPVEEETGVTREVSEQQEQRIAFLKQEIDEWLARSGNVANTDSTAKLPDIGLLEDQLRKAQSTCMDLTQQLGDMVAQMATVSNRLARASVDKTGIVAEESDRTPIFCVIRYDRFFAIHDVSSRTHPRTPSDRQVEFVVRADGNTEVRLKRETGQTISQGCENIDTIRDALNNIDGTREYLEFVVYPDSYATFQYVLAVLKKRGMAYSWMPLPETEDIVTSPSAAPVIRTIMK